MAKKLISRIYKALSYLIFVAFLIGFANNLLTWFLARLSPNILQAIRLLVSAALIYATVRCYHPYDFPWEWFSGRES